MTESPRTASTEEFVLDPDSASKRPEQLVSLLKRVLEQEFPDAFPPLEVMHAHESATVSLAGLDDLDEAIASEVVHRARAVFAEFVTSPWY